MDLDQLLDVADEVHYARIRHGEGVDATSTTYAIAFSLQRDDHRVLVGSGNDAVDALRALGAEVLEHWSS